ncbi:MAG: hypothetical protein J2P17_10865, partial [Mycobacterium sp.]|nr:hypothetical protein [Mycobacterium sp.]
NEEALRMRALIELRDKRQAAVKEHRFFEWLHSGVVPLARQLDFAPGAALFIMQFRDTGAFPRNLTGPRQGG